jgi:peptide/nickel transport system permease protein
LTRFVLRRLAFITLVVLLIIFFAHLGMRMVGNSDARRPTFEIARFTELAWADSKEYLQSVSEGNLGSIVIGEQLVLVSDLVREAYRNSIALLFISLAISSLIGLPLGVYLALTKHRKLILPVLTVTVLGISTPAYFAALILQQGGIRYLQATGTRLVCMFGFGWDFEHMAMPLLVLAARPLAYLTRAAFLSLSRILNQDYIRTAYSKGLSRFQAIGIHAFRNMAVPALTAVGVSLRFLLGALPIVELFFGWPGVGLRLVYAIDARQTTLVTTLALALGLTFLLGNFILDVMYRMIDPRLRETA